MEVWAVYHEYEEEQEEYSSWHEELEGLYATKELAQAVVDSHPYKEQDHYTMGPRSVQGGWKSMMFTGTRKDGD